MCLTVSQLPLPNAAATLNSYSYYTEIQQFINENTNA